MAKADPKKKKQDDIGGLGFIAAGRGIRAFGPHYIPSGTSFIEWKGPEALKKSGLDSIKTGPKFAWNRGLGEYTGQKKSQLLSQNKRRGWSKAGKTHKYINVKTYQQWIQSYPTSYTAYKGTPDQIKYKWAGKHVPINRFGTEVFEHNKFKVTQQKTTWKTSLKGGKAAKAQIGLGRDRFGMSIKELKPYGKGIEYKGNKGITVDIFGSKKRPVLQPKGTYLFPENKYAVNYLDRAGNVKGLVQRSSKLGTAVSKLNTKQISAGAKLVGKGAAKVATGLSGVGTAWMVYDAAKAIHNYAGTTGHEKQMKKYKNKGGFSATGGY